jgi:hypothetical protein
MTSITAIVTLLESNDPTESVIAEPKPEASLASTAISSPIASGQNVAVVFSQLDLTKKWNWFVPGIYTPLIPLRLVQGYIYRARIDITDQYQNGYPSFFTTINPEVTVLVSETTINYESVTIGFEAAALIALITAAAAALELGFGSLAAVVALGVAATCETAAQLAGLAVNDPPVPDPRFRIVAEPLSVKFSDELQKDTLGAFIGAVTNVIAHAEAMGDTDSRIAGARASKDARSLKLQLAHFQALRRALPEAGREVRRKIRQAEKSLLDWQNVSLADRDAAIRRVIHNLNFRAEAQKAYMAAGGSATSFQAILERYSIPEFVHAMANPIAVFSGLAVAAEKLATSAATAKPTGPTVLQRTRSRHRRKRKQ